MSFMTLAAMVLAALCACCALPSVPQQLQALSGRPGAWKSHVAPRLAGWGRRVSHGRRHRSRERQLGCEAVAALSAELRAGQPPLAALDRVFTEAGIGPRSVAAARWGGDIVTSLRADAARQPLLRSVAACWCVAQDRGAGLSFALDRIVESERSGERVRHELAAHLAAPRATARLLSILPIIGILLGIGFGADPIGWLLGTPPGLMCLVLGVSLTLAGIAWTSRIASRVERRL